MSDVPRALQVHAGPRALAHLRERGLKPRDIHVVAGAAGGPKGLILLPLDAHIFGHWLPQGGHTVDLVGASIGAWRMAAACMPDPRSALERLGHDYIHERYGMRPGHLPPPNEITARFAETLGRHFAAELSTVLAHPRWRLHIITARGRGLLDGADGLRMTLGFAAAVAMNAVHRRGLAASLERVWFSPDGRAPDWMEDELPTTTVGLDAANFAPALLASCTIPFWLSTVQDIPGAPTGSYWDGGLVDYHVHLPYARQSEGLALIPHFQPRLVPGWLDKPLRWRHRASAHLDNAIVLSPSPEWVQTLPGGKIPDRADFKRHRQHPQERERLWQRALEASRQLADEWAEWVDRPSIACLPLP